MSSQMNELYIDIIINISFMLKYINPYTEISLKDIDLVGGKNASIGELINNIHKLNINVPNGFAVNTHAWDRFIEVNKSLRQDPKYNIRYRCYRYRSVVVLWKKYKRYDTWCKTTG